MKALVWDSWVHRKSLRKMREDFEDFTIALIIIGVVCLGEILYAIGQTKAWAVFVAKPNSSSSWLEMTVVCVLVLVICILFS